jgi:hypothetical protein
LARFAQLLFSNNVGQAEDQVVDAVLASTSGVLPEGTLQGRTHGVVERSWGLTTKPAGILANSVVMFGERDETVWQRPRAKHTARTMRHSPDRTVARGMSYLILVQIAITKFDRRRERDEHDRAKPDRHKR